MVMVVVKTRLVNINSDEVNFMTLTVLSNNIITPSLAIAVVSPHCYYNAVFAQSPSAVVSVCSFYRFRQNFNRDIDQCLIYDNYEYDATYNAPFHYRYECSAAFSIKFVSVYIYMLVAIVLPLFTLYGI